MLDRCPVYGLSRNQSCRRCYPHCRKRSNEAHTAVSDLGWQPCNLRTKSGRKLTTLNYCFLRYLSVGFAGLIAMGSLGPYDFRGLLFTALTKLGFSELVRLTPHRIVHFSAFGLLSLCSSLAFERTAQRPIGLGAVILFGIAVEILEFLGSTNPFEFSDVRDDIFAACAGYALAGAFFLLRNSEKSAKRL